VVDLAVGVIELVTTYRSNKADQQYQQGVESVGEYLNLEGVKQDK
jgi:hypothetical protein